MFELDSPQLHVVQQWVLKAEHDRTTANLTLKAGQAAPTDTICFHAQQRVEKYLKALLAWNSIDFPKTHTIKTILAALPSRVQPDLTIVEQERLTEFATVTRYPGDYEPITLTGARRAVTLARRVRRQARHWLPKQALAA